MSLRELPPRPNLEHLKSQANTLLKQAQAGDAAALSRLAAFGVTVPQPKLADSLHVIAREYGFDTWPALKLHLELRSEDGLQALSAAIKSDQPSLVRQVLANGALRNAIDDPLPDYSFDTPALLAAVQRQNRPMVELLLDAGANINVRSQWWAGGFGVLHSANRELADYLISRGAYVDIHAAARLGMVDRVRELLSGDPQLVHARGGDGQLPLHFAATVEIAALLLEHGALIDARDVDHESTAAQYMVCSRQMLEWREPYRHDVARYLIARGAEADILMASALGDISLVEKILNHDPETIRITATERYFPKRDPRAGGVIYLFGFGVTKSPHMLAHQFGHFDVLELLMQRSPAWLRLINAAEFGDDLRVEQLVDDHPQLFQKLSGNAARRIIGTAIRNNTHAMELLLARGWPADPAMDNKQTALHYAAFHGNLAMVNALLKRNAPVNTVETEFGSSPLGWALHGSTHSWHRAKGDYPGVVKALLGADATLPDSPEQREIVESLLAQIATPDASA